MVASGSTNVACESNDESGILESGADSELELSPLAGTPTPPWLKAFPRPGGSNRGSLFFIFAWLGRNLNRRTALQGDRISMSIYLSEPCLGNEGRRNLWSQLSEQIRPKRSAGRASA